MRWNSSRSWAKGEQVLPTRLTRAQKRRQGKHLQDANRYFVPRDLRICAVCGAEGVTGRYCGACAAEAARRTMADMASLSHMKAKSKKEKTRISKVLSNHAVANTWWDPSSLPSWLTEECYVQQIQPQLKRKKVREIGAAIHVSDLYAGFIRSGRRRPHPRHWLALAKLIGVTAESWSCLPDNPY